MGAGLPNAGETHFITATVSAREAEVDNDRPRVRSRRMRSSTKGPVTGLVVAVTGAASSVGAAVLAQLATRPEVRRVVALDRERSLDDTAEWALVDVTDPAIVKRLVGCDVVVHAALNLSINDDPDLRRRTNVRSVQTVLTAAAAAGVRRVVLLSSAMVYGAKEDNPVPLDEDAPLAATPDASVVGDLLEIEALAAQAPRSHAGIQVSVVRPAILVGPGIDTVLTRHFESPRLLVMRGSMPRWQFCHVDDAAAAMVQAAVGTVSGAITVGADGWLSQEEVEALSGRSRVELPAAMAYGTAERLHRLGIIPAPATDLQYVAYPWVVSSARLKATGWRPAYDNLSAFEAMLEQIAGRHAVAARRFGRRETATLGAAGATVAVLGTAAIVRRARRRKRH
jgi:nucleoside-diphosphate-sugar epimerase